ncbi:interleukin-17C [Microcaecilia unicolor]|uniref:Interleukin-17C n=1 Tax=Microcaecilia unicolor TaxID=1415580 RepID=A0A6P7Y791_9AMPH|nr:interleukin-17C [Microcaecilia unicolor]
MSKEQQQPPSFLRFMASPSTWLLCALVFSYLGFCEAQKKERPGGAHHQLCFSQEELQEGSRDILQHFVGKNLRWEKYSSVTLVEHLETLQTQDRRRRRKRHQAHGCPDLQLRSPSRADHHERSISPWRYRINVDENRYPRKLAFAECLCSGCIDVRTGKETPALNSVPVEQTMMVLRRKPCTHLSGAFTFEVDYIKVPVGCTCVLPKH